MQRCPSSSILNEALCFLQQSGIGSDDFTQISIRWCAKDFLYLCVYSVKSRFLCVDLQIDKKNIFLYARADKFICGADRSLSRCQTLRPLQICIH